MSLLRGSGPSLCLAISLGVTLACGGGGGDTTTPPPPAITITLNQTRAELLILRTINFGANVTNTSDTAVFWTVQEGAAGGTINAQGVYTAPGNAGTYHVAAAAQADPTKTATATIKADAVVYMSSPAGNMLPNESRQYTATVAGVTNQAVIWSIKEGVSGGTVTATGLYTAPATSGTYHITATSQADPSETGSATVIQTVSTLFTNSASPVSVEQVGPATTIEINRFAGFIGTVSFSGTGVPEGLFCAFEAV